MFWISVVEREEQGNLKTCRHISGNEPKDPRNSKEK
ncbi:DUF2992 family protein [Paenibacillus sp. FSL K6-2862]